MPRAQVTRALTTVILVPNYTINIRIFVYKRTNILTNEYPNIRYIRFSTKEEHATCRWFWLYCTTSRVGNV